MSTDTGTGRVTVNDVAQHAGVSQSTVSQVLGGSRPVAEATRAKVLASIEALGYRPNQLARALRSQRSQTVAIVVPNIRHELYPAVARGVSDVLRPLGYQVALYDTDNARSIETQVVRSIAERVTDGAVIFGYPLSRPDARLFTELGIAVVNGGLDDELPRPWDTVRVAQPEAMSAMVQAVGAQYDGPVAYIGGPRDHPTSAVREAGFRAGMAALGRPVDPALVTSAEAYSWDAGRAAFLRLARRDASLRLATRDAELRPAGRDAATPDADSRPAGTAEAAGRPRLAVCANDLLAIGAIAAARTLGLRVPDDVAVTGYDNIVAAGMSVPPLTTIETYPDEQGHACARLLLDRMLDGYAGPPRFLTLGADIVRRESA